MKHILILLIFCPIAAFSQIQFEKDLPDKLITLSEEYEYNTPIKIVFKDASVKDGYLVEVRRKIMYSKFNFVSDYIVVCYKVVDSDEKEVKNYFGFTEYNNSTLLLNPSIYITPFNLK